MTNNISLWSVFSKWTFDKCLKKIIFMQHRSENDINNVIILNFIIFQVFIIFYVGIFGFIHIFWQIFMWLSGKRAHSLILLPSKRGVLKLHEGTYLLTNPIPNCPLLQNLRYYENDKTTTNSTKLFLIYMSEIIIQRLEFSGFSWLSLSLIMGIWTKWKKTYLSISSDC